MGAMAEVGPRGQPTKPLSAPDGHDADERLDDHIGVVVTLHVIQPHQPWHELGAVQGACPGDRRVQLCHLSICENFVSSEGGGSTCM